MSDQHATRTDLVLTALEDGILRLTMNRPEARNSLSMDMMHALIDALDASAANPDVRFVVLAAEGKVFCAGHDLKELTRHRADDDKGKAFYLKTMQTCASLMQKIVRHPRPVLAEVQGMATAAGCQLVASCDLAIAADEANFCTPGVNIGLFCSTPMVALTRNVPRKQAMELLLTGEVIDAWTAKGYGLVNRVAPQQYLRMVVDKYASEIAKKSALTLKIGKEAFYNQAEMSLEDAYQYAAQVMTDNMLARDAEEGIGAFLEKRTPEWTDR